MNTRFTISQIEQLQKEGKIKGFTVINTKGRDNYSQDPSENIPKPKRKSKYNNQKTEVDGILFDSKKEAQRYGELKILLKAGEIGLLERQVTYQLGKIARYIADFQYIEVKTGERIVEDVKSEVTRKLPVYRIKKKMKSMFGITIKEV
jgi:hypothetical protein